LNLTVTADLGASETTHVSGTLADMLKSHVYDTDVGLMRAVLALAAAAPPSSVNCKIQLTVNSNDLIMD
jgi:hypothetical protein